MTLREAVGRAVAQNPDITLARLDEENARHGVQVAKDPFAPRVNVGSGLAYSNGFPMSIEGSAPSIVQAHATQFLFNRQQSYAVAQAKEQVRGAGFDVAGKRDEVAYRTASFYLDAERAARVLTLARKDAESLQTVLAAIQAQVKEGRALPLAEKQAALQLARARQLAEALDGDQANAETQLAIAVGFSADDRVRPVAEQRPAPALPESEEHAVQAALESNQELRKLQSQIAAKGLEMRGEKAARLPRVDLVAQYGLFAKFNHYEDYFQHVQAAQRADRVIVPGAGVQRSGRQGADVADGDGHFTLEGSVEQRAQPDQRGFAAIVPRSEEGRDGGGGGAAGSGGGARATFGESGADAGGTAYAAPGGRGAGSRERQVDRVLRRAVRGREGAVERAAADGGSGAGDRGDAVGWDRRSPLAVCQAFVR